MTNEERQNVVCFFLFVVVRVVSVFRGFFFRLLPAPLRVRHKNRTTNHTNTRYKTKSGLCSPSRMAAPWDTGKSLVLSSCGFPHSHGVAAPVTQLLQLEENQFRCCLSADMTFPYLKRVLVLAGVVFVAVAVSFHEPNKPRALTVEQVPVAFWSWRTRVPSQAELEESFAPTHAKKLFLRAGQFEVEDDGIHRIRPVAGTLPSRVETHLVYNATRKFLGEFERLDISSAAKTIADTYKDDLARANDDRANIQGFQLDLDIPNRLLPKYALLIESLRQTLPRDTKISITGLPAWTASEDIALVLAQVDFWIPQFYGGDLPTHASERIPIASPADVTRSTARVRQLGKPFYAGLSAYGYAILYGKDGNLIELRGNIDPSIAARHSDLELIDRRRFDENGGPAETRYEYRASRDLVINGLTVRAGETLILDLPNSAVLRAEARAVRENAGELLLGVCMFRLSTAQDVMILSPSEVAAALADKETTTSTAISIDTMRDRRLSLRAENRGSASSTVGDDALSVDIALPPGGVASVTDLAGFTSYETYFRNRETLERCILERANMVRMKVASWKPDDKASVVLQFESKPPPSFRTTLTTRLDDGRVERSVAEINVGERR